MLSANEEGLLEKTRSSGKTIVFTNGCFDLLHPGHIHQLREAKAQGGFLVVGLNSDASARRLKGEGRPVLPQDARRELLEAIRYVNAVVIFHEDTPEALIREVRPDVLVKGAEYEIKDIVGAEFVEGYGGRVHRVAMLPGYSTSELQAKLK
jgi:D-beta-D-heptose 7-phosphate kinase/D-beta-D-heptose 1-phosphate adenosyltransferase